MTHANICLEFSFLIEYMLYVNSFHFNFFPWHYYHKWDMFFTEEVFWDGLHCNLPIIAFKRIVVYKDGNLTPTHIIELKLLSTKISSSISLFNIIFDGSTSIRSPFQCNKCLQFGHTSKFCRSMNCSPWTGAVIME